MRLEEIGFYTLSDERAKNISGTSPMMRAEIILTGACNFNCPYCRGVSTISRDCNRDMPLIDAINTLDVWICDGLKNVRFSGGEPTLYPSLNMLVDFAKIGGVEHIAISTNGSRPLDVYKSLIDAGVNDFSISLDACCSAFGDKMSGIPGAWETVISNIKEISKLTYVTVGVVLTEETAHTAKDVIRFAHELGVADIRIISAAQYNQLLDGLEGIEQEILDAHPILKYRVNRFFEGKNVRGISETDCHRCHLVKDDSVVAGSWHFPCVIHMREGGEPIGQVGVDMRRQRLKWFETHNSYEDPICRESCLDICKDFNAQAEKFSNRTQTG
jgi:molybdenum cofactor biosynthesis enzyme MoaA